MFLRRVIKVLHSDLLNDDQGQAILEFAITLPLLMVFIVGIYDFSGALNQKQKIEQAAHEGAVIAGAQPMSDIEATNTAGPASLQPVQIAIINSLIANGVLQSGCTPVAGSGGPNLTWTYSISNCPNTLKITIDRGWEAGAGTSAAPAALGTRVKVEYPYTWRFNSVIQLLIPTANYVATTQLMETATVHNQM